MKRKYNPKDIEEILYSDWETKGYFKPNKKNTCNSFCIIMPPPNITGNLHMGHAFQQTIMDILIRYNRMKGKNTLWQMGIDHAGIATQILVLKKIKNENICHLENINKDFFIKKCWEWKNEVDKNIVDQVKRLGNSVDWSRVRFTLDELSSEGVKKVFIKLYNQKLIYKKKTLCYWDTKLQTVISDLEIENRNFQGNVWNIKYDILTNQKKYKKKYLVVSTTRPETLLGDTAIAVHPQDIRYQEYVGGFVNVPIINRRIPIIADDFVDINKGTGCVKITPAHDFNDYEMSYKHNLPLINIFTLDGKISEYSVYDIHGNILNIHNTSVPDQLKGLDRFVARKKIIFMLTEQDKLHSTLEEDIIIPYGDRSGSILEPMLTNQWYLRTKQISKLAIDAIINEDIKFFPQQYKNMYLSWMNKIQDWCISRQLWWGHQIPAWYDSFGNVYVGKNETEIRKKFFISSDQILSRDSDVLDTWFSSSLWTFLSLDWPKKNNLLYMFHPTSVIVSGFDIIFFWIARMIMMTMHCIKDNVNQPQIPFKNIYITGLIKDEIGQKMSKSKGNVIDPIDIIDGISLSKLLKKRCLHHMKDNITHIILQNTKKKFPNGISSFGADALRFTCASLSSTTRSINWDMNRLQGYRNFCNKIWNAGRFIQINVLKENIEVIQNQKYFLFFNNWIKIELNNTIQLYSQAINSYRFDVATKILYDFFWYKFCDWYLEITKIIFNVKCHNTVQNTKYHLIYIFEIILRMSHPIIPFITEYIWKKLKHLLNIKQNTIMLQPFPIWNKELKTDKSINIMNVIQKIILFIRKSRNDLNIPYTNLLSLFIYDVNLKLISECSFYELIIQKMGFIKNIIFLTHNDHIPDNSVIEIIDDITCFIIYNDEHILKMKTLKFNKKMNIINKKIKILNNLLSNKMFYKKASKAIIKTKKEELNTLITERKKLYTNQL